jgi:hypothetical protein
LNWGHGWDILDWRRLMERHFHAVMPVFQDTRTNPTKEERNFNLNESGKQYRKRAWRIMTYFAT